MNTVTSREVGPAFELAHQAWDSVHGEGGECDQARNVIHIGIRKLEHMRTYQPWNVDEVTLLESAIRSLKTAMYQREQTVDDFYAAAHDEYAASI